MDNLCVGIITVAHGIRGQVKVKSFTADPMMLSRYSPLYNAQGKVVTLSHVSLFRSDILIAKTNLAQDRTEAETLKGQELYIERSLLPDLIDSDEFYHSDLLGCEVFGADNTRIGTVLAVHNFGAEDILEIGFPDDSTVLWSFTPQIFTIVDIEKKRLTAQPPEEISQPPKDASHPLEEK